MIYTIENEFLKAAVNDRGCELSGVCSKQTGFEYLWQGDPAVWTGRSPILFPIVGRLIDDKYRLNGVEYEMPKHGFARKMDWQLLSREEDMISFILSETEDTLRRYPYRFDLIVTFVLEGRSLRVTHTVVNKNEDVMYFSFGAHPGFNCAIGDKLIFDEPETLSSEKIDLVRSLRLPVTFPCLNNETAITITKDIFNEDALILHGIRSRHVTLASDSHNRTVRFDMGGCPYLGIWAKPGAPYVCIEPWFGVNDSTEVKNDFSEKDGINALPPSEIFTCEWIAEFSD